MPIRSFNFIISKNGSNGELAGKWPILAAHESSLWSVYIGNYMSIISVFKMVTHFAAFS